MKSYIRNHVLSSFIMLALGIGGLHLLVASLQQSAAASQDSQQQEISALLQKNSATDSVQTLGQIGQNLGGFFQNIDEGARQ